MSDRPRVLVLSLGGTILMEQDAEGRHAAPAPDAFARLLGPAAGAVDITHVEVANVGSPSVRPHDLAAVLELARSAVADGTTGVVLTHGTDTLEESAFLLDRVWDLDAPLVLTGAMRPANAPGADGPANVRDAIRTAVAPSARGLGVLVVLDAVAHLADRVTKASSTSVDAFVSEPSGPVGVVGAHDLRLLYRPLGRTRRIGSALPDTLPRVPVLALGLGDDAELLDLLPADALDGLVIAGVGVGHVPAPAVARLARLTEAGIPVVVATRTARGGTSEDSYDYPGSEVDLLHHGCVMAGRLRPAAARLLLQVLLADGADAPRITTAFGDYAT